MMDEKRCVCGEYYKGPEERCPLCYLEADQSMETPEPPAASEAIIIESDTSGGEIDLAEHAKAEATSITPSFSLSPSQSGQTTSSCSVCAGLAGEAGNSFSISVIN